LRSLQRAPGSTSALWLLRAPRLPVRGLVALLLALTTAIATATPGAQSATQLSSAASPTCAGTLTAGDLSPAQHLAVSGTTPMAIQLAVAPGRELLVEVEEHGIDVLVEIRDYSERLLARADNPVRRTGTRYARVVPPNSEPLRVYVTGKEHANVSGGVIVRGLVADRLARRPECLRAYRLLAAADTDYADGQQVSRARQQATGDAARDAYLRAVDEYSAAATAFGLTGDTALQGEAMHAVAATYYQDIQDWTKTAEVANRATGLFLAVRDEYAAARSQALLAAAWIELATQSSSARRSTATPKPAREMLVRARNLLRKLEQFYLRRGERYDATLQRNNIGLAYLYEGQYLPAAVAFHEAIERFGALHEWPRQGLTLQNLAVCEWGRGDLVAAVRTFGLALEKLGPEPYPQLYLHALTNSAMVNFAIGNVDTALRLSAQALQFSRAVQARLFEGQSLYGLGIAYYALGDRELAGQYLEAALALRTANADARGRVATLRALGSLYSDEGRSDAALIVDEEALALATSSPARARMLVRIAADKAAIGQFDDALGTIEVVLGENPGDDPGIRAQALIVRGHISRVTGRYAEALQDLRAALLLTTHLDDPETRYRGELELARTLSVLHRSDEAFAAADRALVRSDELRRQTANPELRALRQEPLRPAYDLKISLLAEQYRQLSASGQSRAAERIGLLALGTAERQRAQSQADVSSLQFSPASLQRLRPQLKRREDLYRELAARRFRLEELEDRVGSTDARIAALRADIVGLRRDLDTLNADIARQAGVRESIETAAAISWPGRLRELARDTVIVEYWLGAEDAYAWTITRSGTRWTLLGKSDPITEAARRFHGALRDYASTPMQERTERAAKLYDLTIRPLGATIADGQLVIVISDGVLSYVPFAALRTGHSDSASYFIEQHDVAVAPAVWWLMAHQPRPAVATSATRVLLVSDPIYSADDERLAGAASPAIAMKPADSTTDWPEFERGADLKRLPWTARETGMIAALVPAALVDQLSGATATRGRLLSVDLSRYRIIHLASHGVVDASMPQLSALLLGAYDDRGQRVEQAVRAADLELLTLNADIVALSACDTAMGRDVAGEGSVGLAYTALARGAGAVIGSLWQAPDEMSAHVMTEFYRGMLHNHLSPFAALGSAMRGELVRNPQADPALWAAFQLSVSHLQSRTQVQSIDASSSN
jgi:CHAT domain-containing protein